MHTCTYSSDAHSCMLQPVLNHAKASRERSHLALVSAPCNMGSVKNLSTEHTECIILLLLFMKNAKFITQHQWNGICKTFNVQYCKWQLYLSSCTFLAGSQGIHSSAEHHRVGLCMWQKTLKTIFTNPNPYSCWSHSLQFESAFLVFSWKTYHGVFFLDIGTGLMGNIWHNQSCY